VLINEIVQIFAATILDTCFIHYKSLPRGPMDTNNSEKRTFCKHLSINGLAAGLKSSHGLFFFILLFKTYAFVRPSGIQTLSLPVA